MKQWLLLALTASMLFANATNYYEYGDLEVRNDGVLVEVQTKKPANGIGRFYYESGELKGETPFLNGLREGIGKIFYPSGKLKSETPFHDDKEEGVKKEYFENGKLQSEIPFHNDAAEGVAKIYYPNGAVQSETPFAHNLANGVSKLYTPNGTMMRSIEFKNGTVVKAYDYDAQGHQKEIPADQLNLEAQ